jgi:hypothetical protein
VSYDDSVEGKILSEASMAGMVPERRSQREIEEANEDLLRHNRIYMERWLRRASSNNAQREKQDTRPNVTMPTGRRPTPKLSTDG